LSERRLSEVNSAAVRAEAQCGVFVSFIFWFVLGVHSMDRFAAACPLRSDRAGDVVVSHSTLTFAPLAPPACALSLRITFVSSVFLFGLIL
jgi:hypothetical protein